MKPRSAKEFFLRRVQQSAGSLEALSPEAGMDLMLAFYQEERAHGCRVDEDGDMLLYQWGTYDWGDGEFFDLDLTRQFIVGSGEDDDISQLSLTFRFIPTDTLRQLGAGNRWCHSPDELAEFRRFIDESAAYQAVAKLRPHQIELDYGGV